MTTLLLRTAQLHSTLKTLHSTRGALKRNMSSCLLSRLLAHSVAVANKSSDIVRQIMASGELGIVEKTGIADLQTQADRSVQDCILKSLREKFPGIVAIGEEDQQVGGFKGFIFFQCSSFPKVAGFLTSSWV